VYVWAVTNTVDDSRPKAARANRMVKVECMRAFRTGNQYGKRSSRLEEIMVTGVGRRKKRRGRRRRRRRRRR
jgi:hypothetical protein